MLRRLTFRQKLLGIPVFTAAGLVMILMSLAILGRRNAVRLNAIEHAYYPAVQSSRDLESLLGATQQHLRDAVAASDAAALTSADSVASGFSEVLRHRARIGPRDRQFAEDLQNAYANYVRLARRTSERMISGEAGDSLLASLGAMQTAYNRIRTALETDRERTQLEIAAAFRAARAEQARTAWVSAGIGLISLVLVSYVALRTAASLVGPLREAVETARSLAKGDMNAEIQFYSHDEFGQFSDAMRTMVAYLREMTVAAEKIAHGNLTSPVQPKSASDAFGTAFAGMTAYLRDTADLAERVSTGDLRVQVAPRSEQDAFGTALARMTAYLQDIADAADRIAAGDLTLSVTPLSENDHLGNALSQMVQGLSQTVSNLLAGAETLSLAATQITDSAQVLSQTTGDEAAAVESASRIVAGVAGSVARVAEQSRTMESAASRSAVEAGETEAAMVETQQAMRAILNRVTVIGQIASQSDLLALNAAIEAARMGQQAGGFTVLADAIRSLAEESRRAAIEIRDLVSSGQAALTRSADLLSRQVATSRQAAVLVREVTATAAEQSADLQSVDRTMGEVGHATQTNAAAAQELAATAEEMTSQAEALHQAASYFQVTLGAD